MTKGMLSEQLFAQMIKKVGLNALPSSEEEDMFKHIDFYLKMDIKNKSKKDSIKHDNSKISSILHNATVEVKSHKNVGRGKHAVGDRYALVETVNVRGNQGWLYGEANYIAFRYDESFIIVPRTALISIVESIPKRYVKRNTEAIGAFYKRGNDEITLISWETIQQLSILIID